MKLIFELNENASELEGTCKMQVLWESLDVDTVLNLDTKSKLIPLISNIGEILADYVEVKRKEKFVSAAS